MTSNQHSEPEFFHMTVPVLGGELLTLVRKDDYDDLYEQYENVQKLALKGQTREAEIMRLQEQLEAERKAWRKALDSALQYVPLKDHDWIEAIVSNPATSSAAPEGNGGANPATNASEPVEATQGPSTDGNPSSHPGSEASVPASVPATKPSSAPREETP